MWRSPKISILSVISVRTVSTKRPEKAFARELQGRDHQGFDAALASPSWPAIR
jgi:hypothetical protein